MSGTPSKIARGNARQFIASETTTDVDEGGPAEGAAPGSKKEKGGMPGEPFNYQGTDVSADRITIEWILTPENAGKQFKREWFQGDVIKRRKNVPINYNF